MSDKSKQDLRKIDLNTPQRRLKYWIYQNYPSINAFGREIGLNGQVVQAYIGERHSIFGRKYQDKLKELGLNLGWYLFGDDASAEPAPIDLINPQRRLRHWIYERFESISAFAEEIRVNPRNVQPYIRDGGSIYGLAYQGKLKELGLDLGWYLFGGSTDQSIPSEESFKPKYAFQALENFITIQQKERTIKLYTDTIEGVQKYAEANNYEFDFALEKLIVDRLAQITEM